MSEFDYASAPESKAIANIASNYGLFIGGKFVEPKQGKSFNTFNPATEELLSKIGYADKSDIDAAVKSARLATQEFGQRCQQKKEVSTFTVLLESCRSEHESLP